MCLTVKSKLKTAKKDIYVAKLFNKSVYFSGVNKGKVKYITPYRHTIYQIGEHKTAKNMSTKKDIGGWVNVGLHSFIQPPTQSYFSDYDVKYSTIMICKIPKGAHYYTGLNGDIVSNQLIIIGEPTVNLISKYTSYILKRTVVKYCIQHIEEKYGKQTY